MSALPQMKSFAALAHNVFSSSSQTHSRSSRLAKTQDSRGSERWSSYDLLVLLGPIVAKEWQNNCNKNVAVHSIRNVLFRYTLESNNIDFMSSILISVSAGFDRYALQSSSCIRYTYWSVGTEQFQKFTSSKSTYIQTSPSGNKSSVIDASK